MTESSEASPLPLRGSVVQLRAWSLDDVPVEESWRLGDHPWRATDGPYFTSPTDEQIRSRSERMRRELGKGNDTFGYRTLVVADLQGALVGNVSQYAIDETGWTAVGLAIYDPAHWGRGYGTEALSLWVDLLFRTRPTLHRLDARTWSGNTGMVRVAERVGFQLEARFREARVVKGERFDGLGFGLLRSEWEARRSS